ncbi:putative 2OG-Fe(II) oxygenase [Caulobacter sp. DWR1-3-2b1]|uniref:putative 2OG-Fe(II) oxygenase n=1 Tax=Caulobacter sp. DWR1-3-2b1 TaxID=2804670 RepID=UPI003CEFDEB2
MTADVVREAWALVGQGRAADAVALTRALAASPLAGFGMLVVHAAALKGVDRHDEAVVFNRRAVAATPNDRIVWYNLAATLGDLAQAEEAEAAVRKAIALGLDAPEAWLVLGRALQGQSRYDEAEAAFKAAIARRDAFAAAHRNLAQLRWMRSGDLEHALQPLKESLARASDSQLILLKSTVEEFAGDKTAASATLNDALIGQPNDALLLLAASHIAGELGQVTAMLAHAQAAERLAPQAPQVLTALAEAHLAAGDALAAAQAAQRQRAAAPLDQYALALQSTAWRLTDDPRRAVLADYLTLVRSYTLPTPDGWESLEAYLNALRARLAQRHDLKTHPLQQSLRGGSQVPSLHQSPDPLFQAFYAQARKVVTQYLAEVAPGDDPLRSRATGDFRFSGGWSVRLQPNGFHADHVHPQGWISSAFYLDLPSGVADHDKREGWIKFGQPGCVTRPALEPEHEVRPEPGMLVLFPSYMWHGTRAFTSPEHRLTMAFDVVPA